MKLILLHGRDDPDADMDYLGYVGPVLEDVKYIHVTYLWMFKVGFETPEAAQKAHDLTGWPFWDDTILEMKIHDDLIEANGKFYGDWECMN